MWHKPCRTFHPWCPCIKDPLLVCDVGLSLPLVAPILMVYWDAVASHFCYLSGIPASNRKRKFVLLISQPSLETLKTFLVDYIIIVGDMKNCQTNVSYFILIGGCWWPLMSLVTRHSAWWLFCWPLHCRGTICHLRCLAPLLQVTMKHLSDASHCINHCWLFVLHWMLSLMKFNMNSTVIEIECQFSYYHKFLM